MQQLPDKIRRPILYVLLFVALAGSSILWSPACTELTVKDVETGLLRPATLEEAAGLITEGADIAKAALVATGHPEWYGLLDVAMRLAVFIYAIRFGKPLKPTPQASSTEGAA